MLYNRGVRDKQNTCALALRGHMYFVALFFFQCLFSNGGDGGIVDGRVL